MSIFLNFVLIGAIIFLLRHSYLVERKASFIAGREREFSIYLAQTKQIRQTEVEALRAYNAEAFEKGLRSARRDLGEI